MRPGDLTFLHGAHTPWCDARVDKRFVGYHTLQYMRKGGIELSYDGRAQTLEGRWFWPAYPGPHVRFHPAPAHGFWEHRYVAFTGPLVAQWVADGLFPDTAQPAPDGWDATGEFDALLSDFHAGGRWGTLRAINRLERILIVLAEHRAQPVAEPWLTNVVETLSRPGEFEHDYDRLASDAGMALSTLRRRFHDATGVSIHAYAVRCRIAEARRRLGETDEPVKTIARKLGYRDVFFFSKQFRKVTGLSPAAFRKSRQV
jgi:AraC-like DNA-binding protein